MPGVASLFSQEDGGWEGRRAPAMAALRPSLPTWHLSVTKAAEDGCLEVGRFGPPGRSQVLTRVGQHIDCHCFPWLHEPTSYHHC